jgi:hypothetical protein
VTLVQEKDTLREYLLHHTWQDTKENTLAFSDKDFYGEECDKDFIWLYLDEGCRCGGKILQIKCSLEQVILELEGCGKKELIELLKRDVEKIDLDGNC